MEPRRKLRRDEQKEMKDGRQQIYMDLIVAMTEKHGQLDIALAVAYHVLCRLSTPPPFLCSTPDRKIKRGFTYLTLYPTGDDY